MRVEGLDPPDDATAAALTKLRPQRDAARQRRPAPLGELRQGRLKRLTLEFAAANRAMKAAIRPHDHPRAGFARA